MQQYLYSAISLASTSLFHLLKKKEYKAVVKKEKIFCEGKKLLRTKDGKREKRVDAPVENNSHHGAQTENKPESETHLELGGIKQNNTITYGIS